MREKIHEIIFEADTRPGKIFDIALMLLIILSVAIVVLETVDSYSADYGKIFRYAEWTLTILFTIEYLLRIYSIRKPWKYIFSFYGIVDLLAILPTYLSLFIAGSHYLLTIRALRLLRVFRVFKIARYINESRILIAALKASRPKIMVFLFAVTMIVIIVGSLMYLVEGNVNDKLTSIPKAMYWAIVTMTTVGYGDITPVTSMGQFLASLLMITGYAIIAVPTGIVTAEITRVHPHNISTRSCQHCSKEGHTNDAVFCKYCGEELD